MNILGMGVDAIEFSKKRTPKIVFEENTLKNIPLIELKIGIYQPRNRDLINGENLLELVDSIKKNGVLQPILVRKTSNECYEVIAGERRYLACKIAGFEDMPCIVKHVSETEAYALAIVENVQRDQLTQLEESQALLNLKDKFNLSVEEVSMLVGKHRTTISNLIRVSLYASPKIKNMCANGLIEFGHLRAVLSLDHEMQDNLITYVVNNNFSVRKTEELIRQGRFNNLINLIDTVKSEISKKMFDDSTKKLNEYFSSPVRVKQVANGKIRLSVDFESINAFNNYVVKLSEDK
ncbi:MAG: ParB/RepB/Spo0J family partition protein [Legionella sp.]|uniref:ParB/RepB/Spo0J family partition protein n=1 Tax=Legionella sp. TaxID=459 RepID=UPI0039E39356